MSQHILIPLDGSVLAEAVVPQAAALARAINAEVTLFQVIAPSELRETAGWGSVPAPIRAGWVETALARVRAGLDAIAERLQTRGSLCILRCSQQVTWRRRSSRVLNGIQTPA